MKVVTIGGGTGGYIVDKGLSQYDLELTSITTPFDAGGSAGKLRDEFGTLPQGDVRRRILAQSHEDTSVLRDLFAFRFPGESSLNDHSLGNVILTAAIKMWGEQEGIDKVARLFNVRGRIIPASYDHAELLGELDDGHILKTEEEIDTRPISDTRSLVSVSLSKKTYISHSAAAAIRDAEYIVICPGDLYTSIIPNFLIDGMSLCVRESKAKVIFVMNVMSKFCETHNFTTDSFISEMTAYSGIKLDYILINNTNIPKHLVDKYKNEDNSHPVICDMAQNNMIFVDVIASSLFEKGLIRHDASKLARAIMNVMK